MSTRHTDNEFEYRLPNDDKISGREDLTPEAQVVRFADDISGIVDLVEGKRHELLNMVDVQDAFEKSGFSEGQLGGSFPQLFTDLSRNDASRLLTYFVSDLIKTSLPKLKCDPRPDAVTLSDKAYQALMVLRKLIKDKLHESTPLRRGDLVSEARIEALCNWYHDHPESLVNDMIAKIREADLPYNLDGEEMKAIGDPRTNVVLRCSIICDFISILTDDEIRRLSDSF